MSDWTVIRKFEVRAIRPLWLVTILGTIAAGLTRHWWSLLAGVVALFALGVVGAGLHPLQSSGDLAKGPLDGPVGKLEQRVIPTEVQRALVARACTQLSLLLAAMLSWALFAFIRWRWFVVLPLGYLVAVLFGGILKYKFTMGLSAQDQQTAGSLDA
jgi:hypothetical protein